MERKEKITIIKKEVGHISECPIFKDYVNEEHFKSYNDDELDKILEILEDIKELFVKLCNINIDNSLKQIKAIDKKVYKIIKEILN